MWYVVRSKRRISGVQGLLSQNVTSLAASLSLILKCPKENMRECLPVKEVIQKQAKLRKKYCPTMFPSIPMALATTTRRMGVLPLLGSPCLSTAFLNNF